MRRLPLVSALAMCGLIATACGSDDPDNDPSDVTDADSADTSDDTLGEDTSEDVRVEDDTDEDTATADAADAPEPDVEGDAADDIVEDVAPPECEEGFRVVGQVCADEFDRICVTEADCREGEGCENIDDEGYGTCILPLPEGVVCPGGPGCESGDTELRAAFGARIVTPPGWELAREGFLESPDEYGTLREFNGDFDNPTNFCDCGVDMICPPELVAQGCRSFGEYTGPDADGTEGDGRMQGAWIAGFGNNRLAAICPDELLAEDCEGPDCCVAPTAHDHLWARGAVIEQNGTRIALITVDNVGYFFSEVQRIEAALDPALGIDEVVVTATHTHEAPDTMGRWGPGLNGTGLPTITGLVDPHMAYIREQVVDLITTAAGELEPVDVYASQFNTGTDGFAIRDSRHPFIFNDVVTTLHFVSAGGDRTNADDTVGTFVNWHSHPEVLASGNPYISSDFPHYFREYLENGFEEEVVDEYGDTLPAWDGLGGTVVYISGSVGGLLNPLSTPAKDREGNVFDNSNFAKAHALGQRLADRTFAVLDTECEGDELWGCTQQLDDTALRVASEYIFLPVQNQQFQLAAIGLAYFDRDVYNLRADERDLRGPYPEILSRITQIRLGPVAMQTFPGEVFSETIYGGYLGDALDNIIVGNWRDVNCAEDQLTRLDDGVEPRFPCILEQNTANPPDLNAAPTDGYVRAAVAESDYFITLGLGNDSLGYLVPEYDFQWGAFGLGEAEGDHYEETVSIGPYLESIILPAVTAVTERLDELDTN